MALKPPKYLLLWERMGDYHRARVSALSRAIGKEYVWAGDLGNSDGLYGWERVTSFGNYFVLTNRSLDNQKVFGGFCSFRKLVKTHKITTVCVPGYGRPVYVLMLIWSKLCGRKVIMFAESWYPGNYLTDRIKGVFLKLFTHFCFVSGANARHHFSNRLHYPSDRILTGYSVVDNEHFKTNEVKKPSVPQLLCVARFSEEKNLHLLISAFKKSEISKSWKLILAGSGPQKENLLSEAADARIEFLDWIKYNDLPGLYATASCFILPSTFEPWGLVVNEAMAAGLPIIVSDKTGALPDLLSEANGWKFNSDSERELISVLDELSVTNTAKLQEMGKKSLEKISKFTPDSWAKTIIRTNT